MTWLKTSAFCAAIALSGAAAAQDEMQDRQQPMEEMGQQGERIDVSGVVTEVDKGAGTLTVVTPLPSTTITRIGDAYVVDRNARLVAIHGQWNEESQIMRDGKQVKLGDLEEGDVVRTSYDAASDSFGDVSAMSKKELRKELKKEMEQIKEESKEMEQEMR